MHDICVRWHQSTEVGFLCLLCKRRLSDSECQAHVFSWEHVATFLVSIFTSNVSRCIIFPLMVEWFAPYPVNAGRQRLEIEYMMVPPGHLPESCLQEIAF